MRWGRRCRPARAGRPRAAGSRRTRCCPGGRRAVRRRGGASRPVAVGGQGAGVEQECRVAGAADAVVGAAEQHQGVGAARVVDDGLGAGDVEPAVRVHGADLAADEVVGVGRLVLGDGGLGPPDEQPGQPVLLVAAAGQPHVGCGHEGAHAVAHAEADVAAEDRTHHAQQRLRAGEAAAQGAGHVLQVHAEVVEEVLGVGGQRGPPVGGQQCGVADGVAGGGGVPEPFLQFGRPVLGRGGPDGGPRRGGEPVHHDRSRGPPATADRASSSAGRGRTRFSTCGSRTSNRGTAGPPGTVCASGCVVSCRWWCGAGCRGAPAPRCRRARRSPGRSGPASGRPGRAGGSGRRAGRAPPGRRRAVRGRRRR